MHCSMHWTGTLPQSEQSAHNLPETYPVLPALLHIKTPAGEDTTVTHCTQSTVTVTVTGPNDDCDTALSAQCAVS